MGPPADACRRLAAAVDNRTDPHEAALRRIVDGQVPVESPMYTLEGFFTEAKNVCINLG